MENKTQSNSQLTKIVRKQKRCSAIVSKEIGIQCVDYQTEFIGICNAGLTTGLREEVLLQETLKFGKTDRIIMIPNKSYCFLKTHSLDDAISIYNGMHGQSKIGQNNAIIYLAYFHDIPNVKNLHLAEENEELPPGLIIVNNFINEAEENLLLKSIQNDDNNVVTGSLKHRMVKHYGYEFLYGTNGIDPNKPLEKNIPNECDFLWNRLRERFSNLDWYEPDQLTVNQYQPGQGIPPHVDTHSAFLDPLLVVSLEGDVVMEFKHEDNKRINVLIPKRSLLIMSKESRYDWLHGITPRYMDIVRSENGGLTVKHRQYRTSLTFRKLRKNSCDCNYPRLCDSRLNNQNVEKSGVHQQLENCAQKLETENVHKVYDEIANHFSKTRHTPWPKVSEFLNSFDTGSIILDVGCGNGKYLNDHSLLAKIGCDRSEKLLTLCHKRNFNVFKCDCLSLPFRDNCVDGCISIAVIHHLATEERRLQAIKEMIRILKKNGKCLIYVWAKNQEINNKKSSYLRQGDKERKENENKIVEENVEEILSETIVKLPVHVNGTRFEGQDIFVPWKLKDKSNENDKNGHNDKSTSNQNETFLRYYHVFDENELGILCKLIENVQIENSYYDEGNWCIVLKKL